MVRKTFVMLTTARHQQVCLSLSLFLSLWICFYSVIFITHRSFLRCAGSLLCSCYFALARSPFPPTSFDTKRFMQIFITVDSFSYSSARCTVCSIDARAAWYYKHYIITSSNAGIEYFFCFASLAIATTTKTTTIIINTHTHKQWHIKSGTIHSFVHVNVCVCACDVLIWICVLYDSCRLLCQPNLTHNGLKLKLNCWVKSNGSAVIN